jgi:Ni,Fe-hydrogenase III large subunit
MIDWKEFGRINDELEWIWKKADVVRFKVLFRHFLEILKKTMKNSVWMTGLRADI